VGLERGTLSLVSTTEELLDRKVAAPVYKTENTAVGIRHTHHVAPFIRKSWQSLLRQAAVARGLRPWSVINDMGKVLISFLKKKTGIKNNRVFYNSIKLKPMTTMSISLCIK
jgi:hypothetical protein